MRHQVIFDTDIATDVDDVLALAVLLGSPEVDLLGVTTVHADVEFRARFIQALFRLRPGSEIPVHAGLRHPLARRMEPYWEGHEGSGLLSDDLDLPALPDKGAIAFLIETVLARPGEVTLLAVGPLTNVAAAMVAEPRFAGALKRLVIMGGVVATYQMGNRVAEHNIWLDPEAAQIVFASEARGEVVPLDVTLQVTIDQEGVNTIRSQETPYHHAVADQIERYHGFINRGQQTFLHDPLAALAVLQPDLLGWRDFAVQVETDGHLTRGMTVALRSERPNASVAMDVDAAVARAAIVERICGRSAHGA